MKNEDPENAVFYWSIKQYAIAFLFLMLPYIATAAIGGAALYLLLEKGF